MFLCQVQGKPGDTGCRTWCMAPAGSTDSLPLLISDLHADIYPLLSFTSLLRTCLFYHDFYYFIIIILFLILLPPWLPHTPRAKGSGIWRTCKFFQRPESWAKHTGKSPGQQSTWFQPYPSSFVIFSCKTKTFQTVLSKYGKSFMQSIQRVHLSMVCNT